MITIWNRHQHRHNSLHRNRSLSSELQIVIAQQTAIGYIFIDPTGPTWYSVTERPICLMQTSLNENILHLFVKFPVKCMSFTSFIHEKVNNWPWSNSVHCFVLLDCMYKNLRSKEETKRVTTTTYLPFVYADIHKQRWYCCCCFFVFPYNQCLLLYWCRAETGIFSYLSTIKNARR